MPNAPFPGSVGKGRGLGVLQVVVDVLEDRRDLRAKQNRRGDHDASDERNTPKSARETFRAHPDSERAFSPSRPHISGA